MSAIPYFATVIFGLDMPKPAHATSGDRGRVELIPGILDEEPRPLPIKCLLKTLIMDTPGALSDCMLKSIHASA